MPLSALVGRRAELTALLAACTAPAGGITLLTGEAGIGKSRLLDELAERLRATGVDVLRGHAVPGGGPFRPLVEALVRAAPAAPATDPRLVGFRAVLARLLPGWPDPPAAGAHVVDPVVVLAEAVRELLGVLADTGPRVVLIDDLHWSDPDTLAVLEYLGGSWLPVRIVAAARVEAVEPLAALRGHPGIEEIPLSPLTAEAVSALAGLVGGAEPEPAVATLLAATADGLPLLVEELTIGLIDSGAVRREAGRLAATRALDPPVPDAFARLVAQRLATLDPAARDTVIAAAVLGPEFDWALLPPVTGTPERAVADALRAARDAGLLVTGAAARRRARDDDAGPGGGGPPRRRLRSCHLNPLRQRARRQDPRGRLTGHPGYELVVAVVVQDGQPRGLGGSGDQQVRRRNPTVLPPPGQQCLDVASPFVDRAPARTVVTDSRRAPYAPASGLHR